MIRKILISEIRDKLNDFQRAILDIVLSHFVHEEHLLKIAYIDIDEKDIYGNFYIYIEVIFGSIRIYIYDDEVETIFMDRKSRFENYKAHREEKIEGEFRKHISLLIEKISIVTK